MATLESPGVQVQVVDESFYTPAAPGTIPLFFVATAQDKNNPSGTTALGTTQANAGKVWLITSQRDLTDTFGTPLFYTDASGNPQHGNELNEYGLQAAYSSLGISSRAYIVRADVDLGELVPTSSVPVGDPVSGTYWLDTSESVFGIKEWNTVTQRFSNVSPIVLDDLSPSTSFSGLAPDSSIGSIGNYCLVMQSTNQGVLYYKNSSNTWEEVVNGFDSGKRLQVSPHYDYPIFDASTATGSVWVTTTVPNSGADIVVKYYSGSSQTWTVVDAPLYPTTAAAAAALDSVGGGKNIPVGTLFTEYNYEHETATEATFKLWRRGVTGATTIVGDPAFQFADDINYNFYIKESLIDGTFSSSVEVTLTASTSSQIVGSLIPTALSAAGLQHVSASWNAGTNVLTITHALGGDILIDDGLNAPMALSGISTAVTGVVTSGAGESPFTLLLSNWRPLVFESQPTAPYSDPQDGQLWYNSVVDEVDILYHNGTTWVNYLASFPTSDPAGPIVSATEPTEQSDGTPLVTGDIWVDTSDLENYGRNIYVYDNTQIEGEKWVLQDVTDQSTPNGWLFADARWSWAGSLTDPGDIATMLQIGYLDPDAPDPALYPRGMRLWNTRRSGFNVKKYVRNYIDISANNGVNPRYSESMSSYETDRWVSQNNVGADGAGVFGRKSQRAQVVEAFKSTIDTNAAIRDTDTLNFNLIACPGYVEAAQNLNAFNTDRGITAFVIADTPFRLRPTGTELTAWGLNTNGALDNGDVGATSYDEYMAMYYPSGYTNDNAGNPIVVPPSHMVVRTILNSDAKSYQWFAPAGTRRGGVDNASSVGYIDAEGEFRPVALHQGLRDVLDDAKINPIATLTGVGLIVYGQRTRARNASALDRINVARLVAYLRRQLDVLARPFLFEPNDAQTRREIKAAAESLLLELVGQRALYDFIVVCDETNNTPSRIDRNELYMDVAIEPVKSVEFIYIPLRLKNTGDIAAGL